MKEKLKIYAIHSFDEDSREHEMFKKDYYKHVDVRNEPNNEFINEASIVTWLRDNCEDDYTSFMRVDFLGVCHYRRTLKIDEDNLDWKKIYVHTEDLKMPIESNFILFHNKQFYDMFKHTFQTKFSKKRRLACENWDKYFKSEGMPFYGRNLFVMPDFIFDDWRSFMYDCIVVALSVKQAMSNDEIWTNVYDKRTAGAMLERMTSYFIWLQSNCSGIKFGIQDCEMQTIDTYSPYQRDVDSIARLYRNQFYRNFFEDFKKRTRGQQ